MPSRSVTILVPVFNEEEVIELFLETLFTHLAEIEATEFEVLFVDDGSRDASLSIIQNLATRDSRISYLSLSRNFGKERAMIAGLDAVTTDAVIIMDVDLQDPPGLISEMIQEWRNGADDVYAKRRTRHGENWLKRTTAHAYYRILQRTTRIEVQQNTGDFRLLDRKCIDALTLFRESERYTKGMFSWIGFTKKEILFDRDPRAAGRTKWNYGGLINLAIDGITSFTTAPLRVSTVLGILVSLAAFIYLIVIVLRTLLWGSDLQGYPSMMVVILFLGGVQLLSVGVIGEYIGRIFNESKNRPLYLIGQQHRGAPH
ncbi:glycosyltransferase family 2 protein [Leucobacter sp. CSA2]|uniref:Glycosyltransferase family 2 protein n=1 Tax=Leucobacter edaphi TaxID=2796472 RepID=A0A934QE52_9MICO|nr:glycosyltransferase family 2 protein [Leucobacter edaphi]MBK0421644.1 glycosyltransferase family 2 protein [Leucobacter edaphi]